MAAKPQKQIVHRQMTPKRVRQAAVGADGLTFGDRLRKCMEVEGRSRGQEYRQTDLIAEATRLLGRDPERDPVITQQGLSLILSNKVSESHATTAFAKLLKVESMWLQYGVGPASYLDSVLGKK
jgi:hypothetical protein